MKKAIQLKDYNNDYLLYRDGRVFSLISLKFLKPQNMTECGSLSYRLKNNNGEFVSRSIDPLIRRYIHLF